MVKDENEESKWFHQWVTTMVDELKDQRKELGVHRDACIKCREEVLAKVQNLDKQLAVTVAKVGSIIALVTFLATVVGEILIKTFLGKTV